VDNRKAFSAVALAVAGALTTGVAGATDGYFSHGYGMKAKGRGGVSTAMTTDTFGGANNPATMVWVGDRVDIGVDLFRPDRKASRTGSPAGVNGAADGNDTTNFLIPEFGYNKLINPDLSLGVTVYGNGGMNTDYSGSAVANCGAVGGGAPANLTNKGYDSAWGWGVRVGWMGRLTDTVSVGAAYSSKIKMDEFDKYRGLFAERGGFDIPENYNFGIAFKATPTITIAADYQRINYSKVKSVGNPSNQTPCPGAACLGASSVSIGFGWDDINVIKLGVEYAYNNRMLLRAGYNHSENPIQSRDITFNILAPGVVQNHVTAGFTYALEGGAEITMAYMHAFKKSVSGPATNPYFPVGGTETIEMSQNSLGIAWGKKF